MSYLPASVILDKLDDEIKAVHNQLSTGNVSDWVHFKELRGKASGLNSFRERLVEYLKQPDQ